MTSKLFQISEKAVADLDSIWLNVFDKSQSLDVADKVINAIYEGIEFLGENPEAGHYREDLHPKPVKFLSVFSYLLVYRVHSPIQIARVLPGQMDVETILRLEKELDQS